jgi:hypothetical protein
MIIWWKTVSSCHRDCHAHLGMRTACSVALLSGSLANPNVCQSSELASFSGWFIVLRPWQAAAGHTPPPSLKQTRYSWSYLVWRIRCLVPIQYCLLACHLHLCVTSARASCSCAQTFGLVGSCCQVSWLSITEKPLGYSWSKLACRIGHFVLLKAIHQIRIPCRMQLLAPLGARPVLCHGPWRRRRARARHVQVL